MGGGGEEGKFCALKVTFLDRCGHKININRTEEWFLCLRVLSFMEPDQKQLRFEELNTCAEKHAV